MPDILSLFGMKAQGLARQQVVEDPGLAVELVPIAVWTEDLNSDGIADDIGQVILELELRLGHRDAGAKTAAAVLTDSQFPALRATTLGVRGHVAGMGCRRKRRRGACARAR